MAANIGENNERHFETADFHWSLLRRMGPDPRILAMETFVATMASWEAKWQGVNPAIFA